MLGAVARPIPSAPPGDYDGERQQWAPPFDFGSGSLGAGRQGAKIDALPSVLVVTSRLDPHADLIIDALHARGAGALRLNTEDLLRYRLTWVPDDPVNHRILIEDEHGRAVDTSSIKAAFYRRPARVAARAGRTAEGACAASEGEALLHNLAASDSVPWLTAPALLDAAEAKLPQLARAQQCGLQVPRTVLTNEPERAVKFARTVGSDLVVKPLGTPEIVSDGTLHDFYATRLSPREVEERASMVAVAPTLIQEYVPKRSELRVTVIGGAIYAARIEYDHRSACNDDWRLAPDEATLRPTTVPAATSDALLRFLRSYGLHYGAFDLAERPSGDLVFLENNPSGGWSLTEARTGLPITDAVARLLTGDGPDGPKRAT